MNQGWECPRCHRCWAPTVKKCKECKPVQVARPAYYPYWTHIPYTPVAPYIAPIWGSGTITIIGDSAGTVFNSSSSVVCSAKDVPYTLTVGSLGA